MPIQSTLKNDSSNSLVVSTSNDMPISVLIPANTQRNLMKSTSDNIITDNSDNFNPKNQEIKKDKSYMTCPTCKTIKRLLLIL